MPWFVDVVTAGNRWRVGGDIANDDAEGGGDRLRPDPLVAKVGKVMAAGLGSPARLRQEMPPSIACPVQLWPGPTIQD